MEPGALKGVATRRFSYGIDIAPLIDEMYRLRRIYFMPRAAQASGVSDYKNAAQRTA